MFDTAITIDIGPRKKEHRTRTYKIYEHVEIGHDVNTTTIDITNEKTDESQSFSLCRGNILVGLFEYKGHLYIGESGAESSEDTTLYKCDGKIKELAVLNPPLDDNQVLYWEFEIVKYYSSFQNPSETLYFHARDYRGIKTRHKL